MATQPRCASCFAGEIINEDVCGFFTGYIADESRPFRGWLCEDHADMYSNDNELLGHAALKQEKAA